MKNAILTLAAFLSGTVAAQQAAQPTVILKLGAASGQISHPSASVTVDNGYKLLGGGAALVWSGAGSLLDQSRPRAMASVGTLHADPITWDVSGKDHSFADPASIQPYLIQLNDPDELYEVIAVEAQSPIVARPVVRATLPPGFVLTGGGCYVDWRAQPPAQGNLLTGSYPDETDQRSWICSATEHLTPSPASIRGYVVGIRPRSPALDMPAMTIVKATSSESNHPVARVAGPGGGFVITGGGALASPGTYRLLSSRSVITSGRNQILAPATGAPLLLTASYPIAQSPTSQSVPSAWEARAKDHGIASPGVVTAYAVAVRFPAPAAPTSCVCQATGPFPALTATSATSPGFSGPIAHPLGEFASREFDLWHDGERRRRVELRDPARNVVVNEPWARAWQMSPDKKYFVVSVSPPPFAEAVLKLFRMQLGPGVLPLVLSEPFTLSGQHWIWRSSVDGSVFLLEGHRIQYPDSRISAFNLNATDPQVAVLRLGGGGVSGTVEVSPCGDRLKWNQLGQASTSRVVSFFSRRWFGALETPVVAYWDGAGPANAYIVQSIGASPLRIGLGAGLKTRSGRSSFASLQCEP